MSNLWTLLRPFKHIDHRQATSRLEELGYPAILYENLNAEFHFSTLNKKYKRNSIRFDFYHSMILILSICMDKTSLSKRSSRYTNRKYLHFETVNLPILL